MDNYLSLVKKAANADEVWEERRFQVYRTGNSPLTVTVSDQGPDVPEHVRYIARAESGDEHGGKRASTGNAAPTVEDALENVHWSELD